MADQNLINAFDDCVSRLKAGHSIEDCQRVYPQFAGELRLMLETSRVAGRAQYSPADVAAARTRIRSQIERAADRFQPYRANPYRNALTSLLRAAAILLLALAVVTILNRMAPDNTLTATPTVEILTTQPTSTVITSTHTLTPTPTSTNEPSDTVTISPSATSSVTTTPTKTPTTSTTVTLAPTADSVSTSCVPSPPEDWVTYQVQEGDTLSALAVRAGITTDEVIQVNCLESASLIVAGHELYLPRFVFNAESTAAPTVDDNGGSHEPTDDHGGQNNSGSGSGDDDHTDDDNSGHGGDDGGDGD